MTRRLYPLEEAAELLGVAKSTLEGLVRDGDIETVTIGRRRLVPSECIDEYIERLRRSA